MPHATHSNAALTPRARPRLARLIVDQRWPVPRAAERYDVSWKTRASGQSNRLASGVAVIAAVTPNPHGRVRLPPDAPEAT